MAPDKTRRPSGGGKAFALAVLVHLVIVGLVVVGFRWQAKPLAMPATEKIVQAKTVNEPEVNAEIERLKQQEQRERKAEEQRRRHEEAKKKAEDEKRRKAEEQKAADAKRKLEEEKKRKTEAEKRKAEEQRKLAEAKKLKEKKQDDEARRKEAERNLKEQLAAEERARQQNRRQQEQTQQHMSEIAKYEALIKQKVERSWSRPPTADQGLECIVRVRLVQSGEVMQAQVMRSSGNPAFDRSVENAVYKASPLPLPEDKSLFDHFRELEFKFKPEE